MKSRWQRTIRDLCIAAICINTLLFPISLFTGKERLALYQVLCALGCWVGVLYNNGDRTDGD
jgi:hypothetical protein